MNLKSFVILALAAPAILLSCSKKTTTTSGTEGQFYLNIADTVTNYYGTNNSSVNRKATLGRVLFYDTRLSVNNAVACASCHKQQLAFADDIAFSRGFENKLTARNSMPLENLSDGSVVTNGSFTSNGGFLFWDGRETNLTNLVARPLTNHVEMGITDLDAMSEKLSEIDAYKDLFNKAYGTSEVTSDKISESIKYFIGSITANNSRFDQYRANKTDLTALEIQGMNLFNSKYNCNSCHNVFPGTYAGFEFVNTGLDAESKDPGHAAITGLASDKGRFRTPNLRNVALTAPYMHDGRFNTLDEVLEHYSHNMKTVANLDSRLRDPNTNQAKQMNISAQEKQALVAFLNTLTDYSMITDPKYATPFKIK